MNAESKTPNHDATVQNAELNDEELDAVAGGVTQDPWTGMPTILTPKQIAQMMQQLQGNQG